MSLTDVMGVNVFCVVVVGEGVTELLWMVETSSRAYAKSIILRVRHNLPAIGAPMKDEIPCDIMTSPNALVSFSRPISSTMIIVRSETKTAIFFK